MARTKLSRTEPTVVPNGVPAPVPTSRLPRQIRFPLLVIISLALRSILWEAASNFIGPELGEISRAQNEGWQPIAHLAYKAFVLYAGWAFHYDFIDISALTLLTNAPYTYLIVTCYNIPPITALLPLAIEILSTATPTYLLRPRSRIHTLNAPVPNRFLLSSFKVQTSTSLLAVAVYVFTLATSLKFGLTTLLATHFESLPTLELAYAETPYTLLLKLVPLGIAARTFLFTPSIGAQSSLGDAKAKAFNPATATLPETIEKNLWNWSKGLKVLITQTTVASVFTLLNTIQKVTTIEGGEMAGGVKYGGLWTGAHILIAVMFAWVGDTEDVTHEIEGIDVE